MIAQLEQGWYARSQMPELLIIRHGQCADGAAGRFNGRRDEPLSTLGKQQAEALAHELARLEIGHKACNVYSSPLKQAFQTGVAFTGLINSTVPSVFPALQERHLGVVTGKTAENARKIVKPEYVIRAGLNGDKPYCQSKEYGFESFDEITARLGLFAWSLAITYPQPEDVVLAFMHGDSGIALAAATTDRPMEELIHEIDLKPTGIIQIRNKEILTHNPADSCWQENELTLAA